MKKRVLLILSILLIFAFASASSAFTASKDEMEVWDADDQYTVDTGNSFDIFLNIPGVKGSCKEARHPNQIDILSFSFGGRVEDGSTIYKLFRVNKLVDASSPRLFQAMLNGETYRTATFELIKAGAKQEVVTRITLSGVEVYSHKQYVPSHGFPAEEIQLSYSKIDYSYFTPSPTGTGAPTEIKASGTVN